MSKRKLDERQTLDDAIDSVTQYLRAVVARRGEAAEIEGIAQTIADLCAMLIDWEPRKAARS